MRLLLPSPTIKLPEESSVTPLGELNFAVALKPFVAPTLLPATVDTTPEGAIEAMRLLFLSATKISPVREYATCEGQLKPPARVDTFPVGDTNRTFALF